MPPYVIFYLRRKSGDRSELPDGTRLSEKLRKTLGEKLDHGTIVSFALLAGR